MAQSTQHQQDATSKSRSSFNSSHQGADQGLVMFQGESRGAMMPPEPARPIDPPVVNQWSTKLPSSPGINLDSLFQSSPGSGELSISNRPLSIPATSKHLPLQSVSHGNVPVDPIQRFYHDNNGPWNQHMISGFGGEPFLRPQNPTAYSQTDRPNFSFREHRGSARSEVESNATGVILSDSGYASKSLATTSVLSADPAEYNQECASITGHVDNLQIYHGDGSSTPHYLPSNAVDHEQPVNGYGEPSTAADYQLQCPYCPSTLKCHSERKKHILRHVKPFVCDEAGCVRKEGFSTSNDLDRHKKSVHKINPKHGSSKSYRCYSAGCKTKEKLWPRLDNFRQHLKRMHPSENMDELLRISEHNSEPQAKLNPYQGQQTGNNFGDPNLDRLAPREESSALLFSANPSEYILTQPASFQHPIDSANNGHDVGVCGNYLPILGSSSKSISRRIAAPGSSIRSIKVSKWAEAPQDPGRSRHNHPPLITIHNDRDQNGSSQLGPRPSTKEPSPCASEAGETLDEQAINSFDKRDQEGILQYQTPQTIDTLTTALAAKVTESLKIGSSDHGLAQALNAVASLQRASDQEEAQNIQFTTGSSPSQLPVSDSISSLDEANQPGNHTLDESINAPKDPRKDLEAQVQKILKAGLSNLMKQKATNSSKARRSPARATSSPTKNHLKCEKCEKYLPRLCDMKKHLKRHTKPYGCTFPACNKAFGSKNDWKRHENSQHFQLETWRCHERAVIPTPPPFDTSGDDPSSPNPPSSNSNITVQPSSNPGCITDCARLFFRREVFIAHLRTFHNISSESYIKEEAQKRRIGRNGQSQFWCGFCRRIVALERKGLEAWDERFDHVGAHFNTGRRIEEWVDVGGRAPKGANDHQKEDECPGDDLSDNGLLGSAVKMGPAPPAQYTGSQLRKHSVQTPVDEQREPSRKRQRSDATPIPVISQVAAAVGTTEVVTFCCWCGAGPHTQTHVSCYADDCEHRFCTMCPRVFVDPTEDPE